MISIHVAFLYLNLQTFNKKEHSAGSDQKLGEIKSIMKAETKKSLWELKNSLYRLFVSNVEAGAQLGYRFTSKCKADLFSNRGYRCDTDVSLLFFKRWVLETTVIKAASQQGANIFNIKKIYRCSQSVKHKQLW